MKAPTLAICIFLALLALAVALLIAGQRPAAELTANWAYYALLAAIVLALLEAKRPWLEKRFSAWTIRGWESLFGLMRSPLVSGRTRFFALLCACLLLWWLLALVLRLSALAQITANSFYLAVVVLSIIRLTELKGGK